MAANNNPTASQADTVPVDQFRPEVGNPQLYDVTVYPSWLKYGFHIDVEAKIADFIFPEGVTVSFFWDYDPDKAPNGKTLAPVLWCKAGHWKTPWRNGKPDMHELRVHDLEHPDSMVRWEAVLALYALYVPMSEQYEEELWAAHEKLVGGYMAELWARSKHSPTLSSDEIYARTQDRSWWPEDYLAEERRRYGY
jgi:hypothetical protein